MQVGSTSTLDILRNAYSAGNLNAFADGANSTRLKMLQDSAKALETLRQNMTTSADAAKERAARKLEEAKAQLEMLKSGGFPPEVVARLAAELAHKISAAATEFAAAVAASATSASSATAAAANTATGAAPEATAAANAEPESEDGEAGVEASEADEPDGATAARNAYRSVVEDGKQASAGISAEDRKTMEEFKSILQEVRQLMDKAMRELRARIGNPGSDADGAALEAQVGASRTPTSIVI
ncbi:hypothetical protein ASC97_19680 [Rhizobium sp. Root1203]|uniref:hypothetical protein n=1 Tax=Rhizobium sp. Root1203 TaxID=1736427 RepID=UPI000710D99B|nr:hypothetical protein [Rhizobium sp. Root1203]KQV31583.1 hypothetical protein ASC97_19680 [Rhizobium sp. Root1203]